MLVFAWSVPAAAHKHHHGEEHAQQVQAQSNPDANETVTATHEEMGEMVGEREPDRSSLSFFARLLDWLGRSHPIMVHFPTAFFPAALFTAIIGRRRPGFAAPVQFLVVAGAILTPLAAVLGWLDAMSEEPDPLLTVHRWLGTGIALAALALGVWAWCRPGQDRSLAMIAALIVITAAVIVQGWYGGAMVHGIDHLNW
jgi:uncharacterized membrane protein